MNSFNLDITVSEVYNKQYRRLEKRKNGRLHCEDGPACIGDDGSMEWYFEGNPHRIGGPAIISANGDKEWWVNGQLHREDGPAVMLSNGTNLYLLRGIIQYEAMALTEDESIDWVKEGF